ncbi:MAG: hypothetical protein DRJ01_14600 [Bacteroidetes bacterium]|nr:MAG: hypothetical protein DRJ01_14600 [Bacteroidota bacterium]
MTENLSQRKLLEILTHEIEVLRITSKNINEVAPVIAERLNELKNTKIVARVELTELKAILLEFQNSLKKQVTIPNWFLIFVSIIVSILSLQSIWLYAKFFG